MNVTLPVSGATQTVEVQARETVVQTATAEPATTVSGSFIKNIPLLSRNVYDLAFMAPAVTLGHGLEAGVGRFAAIGYGLPVKRSGQQRQLQRGFDESGAGAGIGVGVLDAHQQHGRNWEAWAAW